MEMTKEDLKVYKSMYMKEATDAQLNAIAKVCKSKQLDPFAGDVIFRVQGGRLVDVTTIDGARRKAARTGEHAGTDLAVFEKDGNDMTCAITVYRMVGGERRPYPAKRWMSETKGSGPVWAKSPRLMLEKCTEMTALRKAFPEHCGGTYEEDEPFHDEPVKTDTEIPETPSNRVRWEKVLQAFNVYGIAEEDLLKEVKVENIEDMTDEHFDKLAVWYEQCQKS